MKPRHERHDCKRFRTFEGVHTQVNVTEFCVVTDLAHLGSCEASSSVQLHNSEANIFRFCATLGRTPKQDTCKSAHVLRCTTPLDNAGEARAAMT